MDLIEMGLSQYWHARHNNCAIDSKCRMMCVLLKLANKLVPDEPEPDGLHSSSTYIAWAERRRIRLLLLANVH